MPRAARKKKESKTYHIVLRGMTNFPSHCVREYGVLTQNNTNFEKK